MKKRNGFDVAVQSLILAAGVILSIALISIMVSQFSQAKNMAGAVADNVISTTGNIQNSSVMQYDGLRITGAEVRNFYKLHSDTHGCDSGVIRIGNRYGTWEYTDSTGYSLITDSSSGQYVAPSEIYLCEVGLNANGVITNITFSLED